MVFWWKNAEGPQSSPTNRLASGLRPPLAKRNIRPTRAKRCTGAACIPSGGALWARRCSLMKPGARPARSAVPVPTLLYTRSLPLMTPPTLKPRVQWPSGYSRREARMTGRGLPTPFAWPLHGCPSPGNVIYWCAGLGNCVIPMPRMKRPPRPSSRSANSRETHLWTPQTVLPTPFFAASS